MSYSFDNVMVFENGCGMTLNAWLNDKAYEMDWRDEWWLDELDEYPYRDVA